MSSGLQEFAKNWPEVLWCTPVSESRQKAPSQVLWFRGSLNTNRSVYDFFSISHKTKLATKNFKIKIWTFKILFPSFFYEEKKVHKSIAPSCALSGIQLEAKCMQSMQALFQWSHFPPWPSNVQTYSISCWVTSLGSKLHKAHKQYKRTG